MDAINRMTSLKAYDRLDPEIKNRLQTLAKDETEGLEYLAAFHRTVRQAELERLGAQGSVNMMGEQGLEGLHPCCEAGQEAP